MCIKDSNLLLRCDADDSTKSMMASFYLANRVMRLNTTKIEFKPNVLCVSSEFSGSKRGFAVRSYLIWEYSLHHYPTCDKNPFIWCLLISIG